MALSKNQIKFINSLKIKKYRKKENLFICEGKKIIDTLLINNVFKIKEIFATENFAKNYNENFTIVSNEELKKITALTTPQEVLAIVEIPERNIEEQNIANGLTLVLDFIQDPGNLGTIIRIADWFGIDRIICSQDTVDLFNPKTIQATMGSIFSVPVFYTDLNDFFIKNKKTQVFGTVLNGQNIYSSQLSENAIIIMGNEANGIRKELTKFITYPLTIPSFNDSKAAESLNVAIATAIVCSEFRRK